MNFNPYMNFQALPDFSAFEFTSESNSGAIVRQVRFSGQKDSQVYHLDLRDLPAGKKEDQAPIADKGDRDRLLATLVQIIEIYTERYPARIIRLKGNTKQKAQLYRESLDRHLSVLCPLFMITQDENSPMSGSHRTEPIAFMLKRKPIPYLSFHTIQTTWSGQSRLFGKKLTIELQKGIRIGIGMPAV